MRRMPPEGAIATRGVGGDTPASGSVGALADTGRSPGGTVRAAMHEARHDVAALVSSRGTLGARDGDDPPSAATAHVRSPTASADTSPALSRARARRAERTARGAAQRSAAVRGLNAVALSSDTRRRLYREGKRLLGPDRMARLRERGLRGQRRARALRGRALGLAERRRRRPWLRVARAERIDESAVLLSGRIDTGARSAKVTLELDTGTTLDVADRLHRYADRRAARAVGATSEGFALFCELPPGASPRRLHLEIDDGAGDAPRRTRVACPAAERAPDALGGVIARLGLLADCVGGRRALLDAALGPAIERGWAARERAAATGDATLETHNAALAAAAPETTIVVPIYGRHDFIAHQLSHFVRDPEIRASELLYVIDDPRLHAAVRAEAPRLARLHDIAFSGLYLPRNLGYAGANNAAAARARGRHLLLLNSDVMPAATGWLGRMLDAIDGASDAWVLGARLLYDDDTVQHDGMRFEAAANFEGLWLNRHPGKGLPKALFPVSAHAEPREAVTGACLLVSRRRYLALGGLDEGYLLGDFEDSDFCLKARAAGLDIAIATAAELYHLERQSQSLVTRASWKRDLTHYNCWRHTRRWDAAIRALQAGRT